jgi:exodeoxyribonuclease V alpha subunit
VVILTKSFRGNDAILDLAASVNNCETDRAVALLAGNSSNKALELDINDGTARIETWLGGNFGSSPGREAFALFATGGKPDPEMSETLAAANAVLFRSTILTLSHEGARGRLAINAIGEKMLRKAFGISAAGRFFPGLPVILGSNHHDLDLYNGDLGVVVATALGVKVLFPRGKTFRLAAPDRLRDLESAFALTVHKSQGSEFGNVLLVLPEKESPLLSRQIVYTGITRAKNRVVVLGQEAIFRKAVERREQREGGVRIL